MDSNEEKDAAYIANKKDLDLVLFPYKGDYELIRIPTLPVPISYISQLLSKTVFDPYALGNEECSLLVSHGILEQQGNNLYISDYGAKFLDILVGK